MLVAQSRSTEGVEVAKFTQNMKLGNFDPSHAQADASIDYFSRIGYSRGQSKAAKQDVFEAQSQGAGSRLDKNFKDAGNLDPNDLKFVEFLKNQEKGGRGGPG